MREEWSVERDEVVGFVRGIGSDDTSLQGEGAYLKAMAFLDLLLRRPRRSGGGTYVPSRAVLP